MLNKLIGGSSISPQSITRLQHTPAANTNAVNSIVANAAQRFIVHGIQWSYSAAPTNGRLTVSDGTTRVDLDITAAGPGAISCAIPCDYGAALTITLAAGGGTVVGKLSSQVVIETA